MKINLISIIVAMILCQNTSAQDHASIKNKIDSNNNPRVNTTDPAIVFDSEEKSTGQLSEDDQPITYEYAFTNKSKSPVVITRVTTSCGCISTAFDKQQIPPGAKGKISVLFQPKNHPGEYSRLILVYTGTANNSPAARLILRCDVKPSADQSQRYRVVMGSIRLKNDTFYFRDLTATQRRVERIEFINTGKTPLALTMLKGFIPECVSFSTEPAVIGPGQVGDLVVSVDGSKMDPRIIKNSRWIIVLKNTIGQDQYMLNVETLFNE